MVDALDGKPVAIEGEDEPVTLRPDPVMKAMLLLGVNCGFGNTDCASLPQSAVDLEKGWIDFPRPKTEIHRRIPLWPETVAALHEAIAVRPSPAGREYAGLAFLTRTGVPWVRVQQHSTDSDRIVPVDPLGQRFIKLTGRVRVNGRRGRGFYTLRHVFETISGESRDQIAVNAIMGHVDSSMAGQYRERISDARLRDVVNVVREWLFRLEE